MLRRAGLVIGALALVWSCGGSVVSFVPDAGGSGEGDASGSSTGSSSGIVSSSSGASSSGVGSSTGSSGGNSASGSGSGSTSSSGGGSGSGSSSGASSSGSGGGSGSGSSSGSSSGGFSCSNSPCISDQECQAACPPVQGGGTNCCDPGSGACYATISSTCPVPADACPSGGPICSPNEAGVTPPNPNTGSTGCDDCIECSCADSWCACMGDSGADGMGNATGCLGYTNCVVACVNGPDGGGVQPCGAMYSPQQVQEGNALISCLAGSCNSSAACGQ